MRRALFLLTLVPLAALAQPAPPGSANCGKPTATCKAGKFSLLAGAQLCLNSTTCSTTIAASASTAGMLLNSAAANSGSNTAFLFNTTATMSGSATVMTVQNNGTDLLVVKGAGVTTPGYFAASSGFGVVAGGASQGLFFSGANTFLASGGDVNTIGFGAPSGLQFGRVAAAGFDTESTHNPVPVVHAAQTTSAVAMEYGRSAASAGGVLAVTFATAFASAPSCVCTDENAVPVICGVTTAPSTSAVTFSITSARADTLDWHCNGAK